MIYLIGSLRNPEVPIIGKYLRDHTGEEIFDDWFAAGPIADDSWQQFEESRNIHYKNALQGYPARHVFDFDYYHLNRADAAVLVLPAGKSAHLEFGYIRGQDKPGWILFDKVPERWDVMYQFATDIHFYKEELLTSILNYYKARTNA